MDITKYLFTKSGSKSTQDIFTPQHMKSLGNESLQVILRVDKVIWPSGALIGHCH